MSAIAIVIARLQAVAGVTGTTTTARIYPAAAPQGAALPNIVARLTYEQTPEMLAGSSRMHQAQVAIECRANTATAAIALGEAVKAALRDQINVTIAGKVATFLKDGPDFTDYSDERTIHRRLLSYTVDWRE
jgi:hypothetical protein